MSKTPSSAFNSKIRGKKIVFSPEDENLISTALSVIWTRTNKNVESCYFDKDKVRLSFKKNEGRVYFDLQESLSEVIIFVLALFWTILSTFFWMILSTFFLDDFVHFFFFIKFIIHKLPLFY